MTRLSAAAAPAGRRGRRVCSPLLVMNLHSTRHPAPGPHRRHRLRQVHRSRLPARARRRGDLERRHRPRALRASEIAAAIREHFGARCHRRRPWTAPALAHIVFADDARARVARGAAPPSRAARVRGVGRRAGEARPQPALLVAPRCRCSSRPAGPRRSTITLSSRRRPTSAAGASAPSSPTSEFARRLEQQMPEDEKIARATSSSTTRDAQGAQGVRGRDGGAIIAAAASARGPARAVVRRSCWPAAACSRSRASWRSHRDCCPAGTAPPAGLVRAHRLPAGARRRHPRRGAEQRGRPGAGRGRHLRREWLRRARVSAHGAVGLMQVLPATAQEIARRTGGSASAPPISDDPEVNIRYGTLLPAHAPRPVRRRTLVAPSPPTTPAAARWGQWRPRAAAEGRPLRVADIPFAETRAYVSEVLRVRKLYRETTASNSRGRSEAVAAARPHLACERVFVLIRVPRMTASPSSQIRTHRRPARGGRRAGRRRRARRPLPDAARRRPARARPSRWPTSSRGRRSPRLVIAHNKTLAAQLCNEFREFFPTTPSSTS